MKLEKLVGNRFRERPSDCIVDSHALMVRGGYMKMWQMVFFRPICRSEE